MRVRPSVGVVGVGGVVLAVAAIATAAVVGASAPATGAPDGEVVRTSSQELVEAATGRDVVVEDALLASGDHLYRYSDEGLPALELRDRAECLGRSRGLVRVTDLGDGRFRLTGVVAEGTTRLVVSTGDGSQLDVSLVGVGSLTYPFFDVTAPGEPRSFQASGAAAPPEPCGVPS